MARHKKTGRDGSTTETEISDGAVVIISLGVAAIAAGAVVVITKNPVIAAGVGKAIADAGRALASRPPQRLLQ